MTGRTRRYGNGGRGSRGLSTVIHYALVTFVVSLLVTGLLVGFGDTVENQQQRTALSTLEHVGNRLADDLGSADRLVQLSDHDGTVALTARLPRRVAGHGYTVAVRAVGDGTHYELVLRNRPLDVAVTVDLRSRTPIAETTVHGGTLTVRYNETANALVVDRA